MIQHRRPKVWFGILGFGILAAVTMPAHATPSGTAYAATLQGSQVSRNWAGYVVSGRPVTAVQARWTVPAPSGRGMVAVWVGLGGDPQHRLLQAGTLTRQTKSGPHTQLWVEGLPQGMDPLLRDLTPGEPVGIDVSHRQGMQWTLTILAGTATKTYVIPYAIHPHTAEWIVEDPVIAARGFAHFAQFAPITFTQASATVGGEPMGPAAGSAISLATPHRLLAIPQPASGSSFTVIRENAANTV